MISGVIFTDAGADTIDTSLGQIIGDVDMGLGDDSYSGGAFGDVIFGGLGFDDLSGGGGNDRFVTLDNDDEDVIDGGTGTDTYDGRQLSSALIIDLGAGTARANGQTDLLTGVERALGTAFADSLTGDAAANQLRAGSGNDTLSGAAGNDVLAGGADADLIIGGDGNDVLQGNDGRDRFFGGAGNDVITGGDDTDLMAGDAGADRFDFNDFNEFLGQSGPGQDRITDFAQGQDVIDLSTIDALNATTTNDAFTFVGTGAINDFGEVGYRTAGVFTIISIGYNSASRFDVIRLDGLLALTAADFIL